MTGMAPMKPATLLVTIRKVWNCSTGMSWMSISRHRVTMRSKRPTVKTVKILITQDPKISKVKKTATILGTKVSVCSFICVAAWKIETIRPTTSATISIGAEHIRIV
jgi:hypothetical protein